MAPLLAEIAACEGRLAELLEGAASVLDALSGVGDADEGDVLARCAGFRDGVRAVISTGLRLALVCAYRGRRGARRTNSVAPGLRRSFQW